MFRNKFPQARVYISQGHLGVIQNSLAKQLTITGLGPCLGIVIYNEEMTLIAHLDSSKLCKDLSSATQLGFIKNIFSSLLSTYQFKNFNTYFLMGDTPFPESERLLTNLKLFFNNAITLNTHHANFNKSGSFGFNTHTKKFEIGIQETQSSLKNPNTHHLNAYYHINIDVNQLTPLSLPKIGHSLSL